MAYPSKTIEAYEELFGIIAVEKGYVSKNDLNRAKAFQLKKNRKNGDKVFLREFFLDKNMMSVNQIEEVVKCVFQRSF